MSSHAHPPAGGELEIVLPIPPVSLQSSRKRKDAITSAIRGALGPTGYLLSGEVEVRIEWLVQERLRYETLAAPDVDNVLKVTLDALCGPSGVLVNDCQVQSVRCHWIDWMRSDQQVTIQVRFLPDEWLLKDGLRFVRVFGPLCFPLNAHLPPEATLSLLDDLESRFRARADAIKAGDWSTAMRATPIQQPFHVGRLREFSVLAAADLRTELHRALGDRGGV